MATRTPRPERRREPLSRERIVEATVELLDTVGEGGLTLRALAEHLATGPGAIYWHVAGKVELLDAATDAVVAATIAAADDDDTDATPHEAIRALALGVFDAIDARPWIGTQLARAPLQSPVLRVLERIGRQVQALHVPAAAQFAAASALLSYILGAAGQNAANGSAHAPDANQTELLDAVAADWAELDPGQYPFIRSVADQLRKHDDRADFLAGVDLILAGLTARQ